MKQKAPIYALIVLTLGLTGWFGGKVYERLRKPPLDGRSVLAEPALTLCAGDLVGAPPVATDSSAWPKAQPVEVPMNFQVLALPWNRSRKPPLRVRALRDAERIYFLLEWPDPTENRHIGAPQQFGDAAAIMFPLKVEQPVTLMMGFLGPAEIWQWKADWDQKVWASAPERTAYADFYPFDSDAAFHPAQAAGNLRGAARPPSAVETLTAEGPGTVQSKPYQRVSGRGVWKEGWWRVVVWRRLAAESADEYAFASGVEPRRIAFAVWDGAQGERGARKSISEWVWLELAEAPARTPAASKPRPARR